MSKNAVRTKIIARVVLLLLIPIVVLAAPKKKPDTIELQVVSTKMSVHGSPPNGVFSYTAVMYTQVNGMKIVYLCDQKGDVCPAMESGKTYMADRVGNYIYISMTAPDDKRPFPVRYRQSGTW